MFVISDLPIKSLMMDTSDRGSSEQLSEETPSSDTSSQLYRPTGPRRYISPYHIPEEKKSFLTPESALEDEVSTTEQELSSEEPQDLSPKGSQESSISDSPLLTDPSSGTIPPPLAPSVEEAYRRKCIQLRQRTNEVEESNEQSRARLILLRKEIQKARLERAFLLENLAKRTSTNVEDSEGSPSPPPTSPLLQPKEKPIRTKRGHGHGQRKASFPPQEGGPSSMMGTAFNGGSPTSETFSHSHTHNNEIAPTTQPKANGYSITSGTSARRPRNSFDLYCSEKRPFLSADETDPERVLALGFARLSPEEKESIQGRFESLRKAAEVENGNGSGNGNGDVEGGGDVQVEREDEDVEMGDEVEGGFAAVDRG